LTCVLWNVAPAEQTAQQNRISGSECGANHCRNRKRNLQQPPGGKSNARSSQQRAWPQETKGQGAVSSCLLNVQRYSVGEQNQREAQNRNDAQGRRINGNVQKLQSKRSQSCSQGEKDGYLRQTASIN
jgi:hypothetical protein